MDKERENRLKLIRKRKGGSLYSPFSPPATTSLDEIIVIKLLGRM